MKIKLIRGVEDGRRFYKFFGGEMEVAYSVSRLLTGTTGESSIGIFTEKTKEEFFYGDFSKTFEFNEMSIENSAADFMKNEISERIKQVKDWVNSIDYKETIEFDV